MAKGKGDAEFEVELLLAGGHEVPIKLSPEAIRRSSHPAIAGHAADGTRGSAQAAGIQMIRNAMFRNRDEPIEVADGDTLWIIPVGSVMAARFRDPTATGRRAIGFAVDSLAGIEPEGS